MPLLSTGSFFNNGESSGGGSVTDPFFSSVIFLAGFEGYSSGDHPTDLDESSYARTNSWNATTVNSAISTAFSVFGTNSLLVGRNFSYGAPEFSTTDDFFPGTGNYTWELFFKANSTPGTSQQNDLIGCWNSLGTQRGYILAVYSNKFTLFYSVTGSSTLTLDWSYAFAGSTTYHIALVKTGTSVELFIDGVSQGTNTLSGTINQPSSTSLYIGGHTSGVSNGLNGYFDEIRLTKGVARYSSDFAIPTQAYPRG